jgi:ribonucleoside-diphosphate reductase alpha chain
MLDYKRRRKVSIEDTNARVDFKDELGDSWQEYVVYHHGVKEWMKITGETDITKSPYWGATANEIDWEAGVRLQAAAQKWICHAISRTTNVPETISKDDIEKVFWSGWKNGCKGLTVYRDGCRTGVLVSNTNAGEIRPTAITPTQAPKRLEQMACEIHHAQIRGIKWTILIGLLENQPYEIFVGHSEDLSLPAKYKFGQIEKIRSGKYNLLVDIGGEEPLIIGNITNTFANSESAWATRLISAAMRHGTPIDFLVEQLQKDGMVTDINKVIARLLKKFIKDGTKVRSNLTCGGCSGNNLVYEEGCVRCVDCGNSKCG